MPLTDDLEAWLVTAFDQAGEPLGEGYQAEVRRFSSPAGDIAVKRPRDGLIVGWLARLAIHREYSAYQRLAGVSGIPTAHGLTGNGWLVMEYVDGEFLRSAQPSLRDPERFYAQLLETIQAMHAAGVVHGDLKRKDNILVTAGERPCIIDFGISRIAGRSWLDNWLFGFMRQLDLNAWIKLKHGRQPAELPAADAALYRPQLIERIARGLRIPWQTLTLRRPRQRLRRWRENRKKSE